MSRISPNPIMQSGVFPAPFLVSETRVSSVKTPLINNYYKIIPGTSDLVFELGYGGAVYPALKGGIKFNGFSKVFYLTAFTDAEELQGPLDIILEGIDIQGNPLILNKQFDVEDATYLPIILSLNAKEDFNALYSIRVSHVNFPPEGVLLQVYVGSDGKIFYFDQDTFMVTTPYISWGIVQEGVEDGYEMGAKTLTALRTWMARPYGKEKLDLSWYVPYTNFLNTNKTSTYTSSSWSVTNWINEVRFNNFDIAGFLSNETSLHGDTELYWNIFQRGVR